jgi:hypothetical protein
LVVLSLSNTKINAQKMQEAGYSGKRIGVLLFCFVAHIGKTFSLNYYLLNFAEQSKAKKPGKQHNILPLWGNEATMNLNPLILGIFK